MIVYRLMCKEEFDRISLEFPLQWKGKTKWFTDNLVFLKQRILDGDFNNSKFVPGRYKYIVVYKVTSRIIPEEGLKSRLFSQVSNNELMLFKSKQPYAKFEIVEKGEAEEWFKNKMTIAIPGDASSYAKSVFHSSELMWFNVEEAFHKRASRDKLQQIIARIDAVRRNLDNLDNIIMDLLKESAK